MKKSLGAALSLAGFVVWWGVLTDAWNYSGLLFPGAPAGVGGYLYGYLSRLLWMLPAFFLIFRFEGELFWSGRQLFSKPRPEPVWVGFLALTTVFALGRMGAVYHGWHWNGEDLPLLTIKLLLVGIGEEAVFRGWGYNRLKKTCSDAAATALSALSFMALHWPACFIRLFLYGRFDWAGFAGQSVSALVCGALFAGMLRRSGTCLNPMLAHFYYDWMLEVFG